MSTAAVQSTSPASQAAAFTRALARAQRAGTIAFKVAPGVYEVPSQSEPGTMRLVQFVGPSWSDWSCTCPARTICVHKAVALFCARNNVAAVRPAVIRPAVVLCANCRDAQVASQGEWCEGCRNLQTVVEPIPFPTVRIQRPVCAKCGMRLIDPLHEAFCG